MSRRDNAERRCTRCRMHARLCVCALIPRIETRTRLVLVIHRLEERKPTNSGLLAARCLPNSEVFVRGIADAPAPRFTYDPATQPLLLYPDESACRSQSFAESARPVTLDRARRNVAPGVEGAPAHAGARRRAVRVAAARRADDVSAALGVSRGRLATLEAIARALEILEGTHVRVALEELFRIMVARTLWMRGLVRADEVPGTIPEAALLDDPRGGRSRAV